MQKALINHPLAPSHTHRLTEQRQIIASMLPESEEVGEVLRLAYYRQDQEVQMDEEGLYLLQKYSNCECAFMGFVGCQEDSKKIVLDTMLNLSGSTGNYFTTIYGQNQDNAILLWSLPYSCRPKTRIFLLSLSTPPVDIPSRKQEILLDLMMLLCSSMVLVNIADMTQHKKGRIFEERSRSGVEEDGWVGNFIEELRKSSQRIRTNYQDKIQDPLWPRAVTTFQPHKMPPEQCQALSTLFRSSSIVESDSPLLTRDQTVEDMLLSLNQLQPLINATFLSEVSTFMIDEMRRISVKQYQDLRLSGNILCKLLINSTRYMNKKPILKVDKIFTSIFKQLYQASILYHSQNYALMLEQQFVSEEPMPYDCLLEILERLEDITMASFNQNVVHELVHDQYENQLLDIIGEKEKLLIEVNYRKTRAAISTKITTLHKTVQFEPQHIRQYLQQLKELVAEHDHHPIDIVINKLDKYSNNLQKKIVEERLKVEKEQIAAIKKEMKQKKQEYREAREANAEEREAIKAQEKAYKKELREEYKLDAQIKALKKEIDQEKRTQKEWIILKSKETKKDTAERLLETIRELEEQVRDNAKLMEEINKEFDYHPQILALNKQIQEKERDIKNIDRLQSNRASQVTPSVTRTVIQKSAIQKSVEPVPGRRTIKRVTAKAKK